MSAPLARRSRMQPLAAATIAANVIVSSAAVAAGQTAATYEYDALILHPRGFTNSQAVAINPVTHEIVGSSSTHQQGDGQALVWTGAGTNVISLSPGSRFGSTANGIDGTRVGGTVSTLATPNSFRATAWDVYARTSVSLHPSNMEMSAIYSAGGGQYVGWVGGQPTSWAQHAALWTSNESNAFVDLNPSQLSFILSVANSVDPAGRQQVGAGAQFLGIESTGGSSLTIETATHALLWSGTAASAVDLHPAGFDRSRANAVADGQQVGYGVPTGGSSKHALVWTGTATSVVDLHPAGFTESEAGGTRNGAQVGAGFGPSTGGSVHALLWLGRPDTVVDLHQFLPAGNGYTASVASGLDEHDNVVGWAITATGEGHAVLWRRRASLHSIWFPGGSPVGGRYAPLLVVLNIPANEDAYVALASSEPFIGVVPFMPSTANGPFEGTVVPSGSQTREDGIWATPVSVPTPVTITATYRSVQVSSTFTVIPASLDSVSISPAVIRCGQSSTGTVTLNGPAGPAGAVVQLTGSPTSASWPANVTVPSGADRATFTVRTSFTSPSKNATGTVTDTVRASFARVTRSASLKCSY